MGNVFVCSEKRVVLPLLFTGLCLLAALALGAGRAAAAGATYYASPAGAGSACSSALPCSVDVAVGKAEDGDTVSLATGSYSLKINGITLEKAIDFGAAPGAPAILLTTETAAVKVTTQAHATLHDLRIEGEGGLQLGSGAADRVFVAYQGVAEDACELQKGTTLRDSVCWTRETNNESEGVSDAIDISAANENQDETVVLRNLTAIAQNEHGNAIHLFSNATAALTVNAANVIARSANDTDIVAALGSSGLPKAHLNITNSDFGEFADNAPEAAVTPLGTAGNISAAPAFLNAAGGDFRVSGSSATLDGGIADAFVGNLDLEGHDRFQAGCFGAGPVPDMGAYERTPTDACPPPPPLPPPPVEPRKPVFRILSLILNKKTGTGRLLVEVPGAGTLSLTGSGVKLVRRTAPGGGGVIKLPIQTWAITKVRLAKLGKTRVRLKVIFEGRSGGVKEWSKAVLLRKKIT